MNKQDFDFLHKQINNWNIKPSVIHMHPDLWSYMVRLNIIELYVAILKRAVMVDSCKEIAPNEYEVRTKKELPSSAAGVYNLSPAK